MVNDVSVSFQALDFPSDGLTIKKLRERHPTQFDADTNPTFFRQVPGHKTADQLVGTMLYIERLLAKNAFDNAAGLASKETVHLVDVEALSSDLARLYVQYGIASGPLHGEQMIRALQSQAAAQASQLRGQER